MFSRPTYVEVYIHIHLTYILQRVRGLNSSAKYLVTLAENASISLSSVMESVTVLTVQMKIDATLVSKASLIRFILSRQWR